MGAGKDTEARPCRAFVGTVARVALFFSQTNDTGKSTNWRELYDTHQSGAIAPGLVCDGKKVHLAGHANTMRMGYG